MDAASPVPPAPLGPPAPHDQTGPPVAPTEHHAVGGRGLPGAPPPSSGSRSAPTSTPGARTSLRTHLLEIERTWLGFASEPLDLRLANAGWHPDDPDLVCPRCAATTGRYEALEGRCNACEAVKLPCDRTLRLGTYEGVLGELVREVKFNRFRTAGTQLGVMLGHHLCSELAKSSIPTDAALLVPVPMSWRRRLGRGIDHTLTLSRGISASSGCRIARILTRLHGPTQLAVNPSERAANVRQSFRLSRSHFRWVSGQSLRGSQDISGGHASAPPGRGVRCLILVDDVRTTGATLIAASRILIRGLNLRQGIENESVQIWWVVVAISDARNGPGKGLKASR